MTRGRQPKVNDEINWVTDEDGNVLGYMKDDKTLIPITELTDAQRANPAILGAAGADNNGGIYDAAGNKVSLAVKGALKFAATRYKTQQMFGTHSGTNIYALHESVFCSPDYIVSAPRFFLQSFALVGSVFPVDRYGEGQITYYGLALKVGSTWYKIQDSADKTRGLDFTNGTKIGPLASGTTAISATSSAMTLTIGVQPQVGDVLVYNNAGTRTYTIVNSVVANSTNWDITGQTYASGNSKYATDTQIALASGITVYLVRDSGLLTAPLPVTIPPNTECRLQLLYAAPGSSSVPGQDFTTAGYVPASIKLNVEKVTANSSRTTVPSGCNDTINNMYGTDLLNTSASPAHSGFYSANTNILRIHTPALMLAKGGDGRPVVLIQGDSIGFGSNDETMSIYNARYCQGYLERGLDDSISSQRMAFGVIAEKGTSQDKWQHPLYVKPRIDMLNAIKAVNNGIDAFDIVLEESGSNATGDTSSVSKMTNMLNYMKSLWMLPIVGVGILPKPSSTDGFQTLANQAVTTTGTGYATNGYLWQMNAGKMPGGIWQNAGLIDDSFMPWTAVSYDADANRDKVAIRPFAATLSSALSAGVYTYQIQVTSGTAPLVGETLLIDPAGTPQEITIEGVVNNGGGSYTVTGYPSGGGATTAASAGVSVTIAHLGQFSGAAVHPSPWASENLLKQTVIAWKNNRKV